MCIETTTARENWPEEDKLVLSLRGTIDAANDVLAAHSAAEDGNPECECSLCVDLRGILYNLTVYETVLESQLMPVGRNDGTAAEQLGLVCA